MAKRRKSLKRFLKRVISSVLSWRIFSDKTAIKIKYRLEMKKKLNLKEPKTFNEKLNWIKLYLRKPVMTTMVDKYEVKKYVSDIIGSDYVIPSIAIYDKWDDVDFGSLEAPFVLKTTHSSGVIAVVKDKGAFDFEATKKKFNKSLKQNYFYSCREWPYKNVKPRIIV